MKQYGAGKELMPSQHAAVEVKLSDADEGSREPYEEGGELVGEALE